jgi:hypothetical protein
MGKFLWEMRMKKIVTLLCCASFALALGGCGGNASIERSFIEKNQGRSWDNLPSRQKAISDAGKQMQSAATKQ